MNEFLDSNFFQTIVLIVTALITITIYKQQKKEKRKESATIILLQIKAIDKNIDLAKKCIINDIEFDIAKILMINKVLNINLWEENRQYLLSKFNSEEIRLINEYYECATTIENQILAYKNTILSSYKSFYLKYLDKDLADDKRARIRTAPIFAKILLEKVYEADRIYNRLPINKFERII